jgi:hypothetical protein
MVALNWLFGEFAHPRVSYSLAKDFNYLGGLMRDLVHRWKKRKYVDDTVAAQPTKVKTLEDYAKNIQATVKEGLLDPVNDVNDCQLLLACTMLGFQGNHVRFG